MKILLIEDDAFFRKFYAQKLQEHNFTVTVAANGEEGIQFVKEQRYNLILLDLIMPKVDGFSFLEFRQKLPDLMQTPVIVFSTLGQEPDIEKAKQLGANDYVNKSFFDFDSLLQKIQTTIAA